MWRIFKVRLKEVKGVVQIGDEYWSDFDNLADGDDSDNGDINGSTITLSRGGPTMNLFKKVSLVKIRFYHFLSGLSQKEDISVTLRPLNLNL